MKKLLTFVLLAAIFAGAFYGFNKMGQKKANDLLGESILVNGLLAKSVKVQGLEYLVDPANLYEYGIDPENSSTLDDPKFTSVSVADEYLADDVFGIDIEVNGEHRFYSYQILNWHQVINDSFGDKNLAVTYCVFCRSFSVFETTKEFDLDGRVFNNNVLLSERDSKTKWHQLTGQAIIGKDLSNANSLTRYPAQSVTWADWKELYPEGSVLSTDTGFARDYTRHPYAGYDEARTVYFPVSLSDDSLGLKEIVHGVTFDDAKIAFSEYKMKNVPFTVVDYKGHNLVAFMDEYGIVRVFENKVSDADLESEVGIEVLDFEYSNKGDIITDKQTGSEWSRTGYAIDGDLEGTQLKEVDSVEAFWFCYSAMYNDAVVPGIHDLNVEPSNDETNE